LRDGQIFRLVGEGSEVPGRNPVGDQVPELRPELFPILPELVIHSDALRPTRLRLK
jgi:hypothetical protein